MKGRGKKKEVLAVPKPKKKKQAKNSKDDKPKNAALAKKVESKKKVDLATSKNHSLKEIAKVKASEKTVEVVDPAKEETKLKLRNAKFIVEPSKRRKIRKTKVIMEGDLNINNVDAFSQQIKPLFQDYDFIDFLMRDTTALDLSHLQMLYYFQNHFIKNGKTVTVDAELSPDYKKIIVNNGFKEFMFIPKLV